MYIIIFILIVLVLTLVGVIIYDSNRFVVEKYIVRNKLISQNVSFVFISDLHNKVYGENNQKLILKIKELKPDFILLGGDIVTARPGKSLKIAFSLVKELLSIAPVYYAMGNHEYRMRLYPEVYGSMYDDYVKLLDGIGIKFLDNESMDDFGITITGLSLEREYYRRFCTVKMEEDYISSLIGKKKDSFQILLAHNPDYFKDYCAYGSELILSGHIHGGMVRLPLLGGVVSPRVVLFPKYDGGVYKDGSSTMILSRGLGMHTIPIRFNNPGEISYITLEKEKENL